MDNKQEISQALVRLVRAEDKITLQTNLDGRVGKTAENERRIALNKLDKLLGGVIDKEDYLNSVNK